MNSDKKLTGAFLKLESEISRHLHRHNSHELNNVLKALREVLAAVVFPNGKNNDDEQDGA